MVQNENAKLNKPTFQSIDRLKAPAEGAGRRCPAVPVDGTYQMGFRTILRFQHTIDFLRRNTTL
jgi:hypothetical protein